MSDILPPMLAVLLVLSLLGGLLYFLRKRGVASFHGAPLAFGGQGKAKQMKVVERVPLGGQHALHLVRVGDRLMLIATGPGTCQIVDSPIHEVHGL